MDFIAMHVTVIWHHWDLLGHPLSSERLVLRGTGILHSSTLCNLVIPVSPLFLFVSHTWAGRLCHSWLLTKFTNDLHDSSQLLAVYP